MGRFTRHRSSCPALVVQLLGVLVVALITHGASDKAGSAREASAAAALLRARADPRLLKTELSMLARFRAQGIDPQQFARFASAVDAAPAPPGVASSKPAAEGQNAELLTQVTPRSPERTSAPGSSSCANPPQFAARPIVNHKRPNVASCRGGTWNGQKCVCAETQDDNSHVRHVGKHCQYRHVSTAGGQRWGRFVGDVNCPMDAVSGTELERAGDGSCRCPEGWTGHTCQEPVCMNGGVASCPLGRQACLPSHRVCECPHDFEKGTPKFSGVHCEFCYKEQIPTPPVPKTPTCDKVCNNLGVLDRASCTCKCAAPWSGDTCDACNTKCEAPLALSEDTCDCTCPSDIECMHDGTLHPETCKCQCANGWSGPRCDQCNATDRSCSGRGTFDSGDLCTCLCDAPWSGSSCEKCEPMECLNGGTFDPETCSCRCTNFWEDFQCGTCPGEQQRIVKDIDCGSFAFDATNCSCSASCEPLDCQNGAEQDPTTCQCTCNPKGNGTDPAIMDDPSAALDATFWSGDDCSQCVEPVPNPCPGARAFNVSTCACDKECPATQSCLNDGIMNNDTCTCDCAPGWGGLQCKEVADGSSRERAAISCKTAQLVLNADSANGQAKSGIYWINPSGNDPISNAFQVMCDMDEDGGGWTELGYVDGERLVTAQDYINGRDASQLNGFHIHPCADFDGMDGFDGPLSRVVMRITMGKVKDFFRPYANPSAGVVATLCSMLQSHENHQWSLTGGFSASVPADTQSLLELDEDPVGAEAGDWIKPDFESDPKLQMLLGGCDKQWGNSSLTQIDGRIYVSFWGGAETGGCCYEHSNVYPDDDGNMPELSDVTKIGWGKAFKIHVQEIVVGTASVVPEALAAQSSKTEATEFLQLESQKRARSNGDKERALNEKRAAAAITMDKVQYPMGQLDTENQLEEANQQVIDPLKENTQISREEWAISETQPAMYEGMEKAAKDSHIEA